ncbi:MAG: hypothetical protein ABJF10_17095 [Chthoniobacter sp.]|uniref:hypothetical protein n=1 Tax=Chthoniobacter sp. TaxID=2510640 RepID=UPI0032AB965F
MNEPTPDDDLQVLFARQRAADHESTSPFHAMRTWALEAGATASQSGLAPGWRWLWPTGAAFALGIVTVWFATHHPATPPASSRDTLARQLAAIDAALQRSAAAQRELIAWQSPTDFLLHPSHHENRP